MSSSCYTVFWFSQYKCRLHVTQCSGSHNIIFCLLRVYLKSTYELSKMGFSLSSFYPKNNRYIKYSAVYLDFLNKLKSGKNNNPVNID